jgi:hypothetical protein
MGTSRIATRNSATPNEWLKTCAQIGELANSWARRNDLVVYAGADAGMGEALACFIPSTAEIEINIPKAFGKATTPKMVGDLRSRAVQYDWAEPVGVVYHEALHSRYSEWAESALKAMNKKVYETFALLDEARIERKGVVEMPQNQLFLRASALGLSLNELNEEGVAGLTEIRVCAHVSALALARVDAGVVKLSDVRMTYDKVLEVLGADLFNKLRSIWVEFQKLHTSEVARGEALAIEWNEALKEADPEGENQEGQGGEMPEFLKGLLEAMEEDAGSTATSVSMDLADQQTKEDWEQEVKERQSESKRQSETRKDADEVFSKSNGSTGTASSSKLQAQRPPTGVERAAAVQIAKMLEKAKYRERSITELKSVMPQGRLKTRVAIQNAALKAKGSMESAPAWRHKTRKHNDDPTLRMGIMVDISGSMSSAMEAMATTAWVMSEAGRRVQAKTAMVYYGSDVFSTLKVGQKLDQVSVYSAPDGTEKFGKAFKALDGALNLTYGDGVKMLVIVSDGHYTSDETNNAKQAVKLCRESGVAVLWITPKGCWSSQAKEILNGYGVEIDKMATEQIAIEIGRAASEALAKSAVGV